MHVCVCVCECVCVCVCVHVCEKVVEGESSREKEVEAVYNRCSMGQYRQEATGGERKRNSYFMHTIQGCSH